MRVKENANDYRYFPDPDLVPIILTDEDLAVIRSMMPDLTEELFAKYISEYKLPESTAKSLCDEPALANLYQAAVDGAKNPKLLANLMLAETSAAEIPAEIWTELTNLVASNQINRSAPAKLLEAYRETGKALGTLVKELGLEQVQDTGLLNTIADEVIAANPKAVADYKAGKEVAIKALMGQVMKRTKGAANPQEATSVLKEKLAKL